MNKAIYKSLEEQLHFAYLNDTHSQLLANWKLSKSQIALLHNLKPIAQELSFEDFLQHLNKITDSPDFPFPSQEIKTNNSEIILSNLLVNKRVVLVGPSQSIASSKQKDAIESYDVVVRLNFGWPVPQELKADVGERMDVLYHCCNSDWPIEKLFNPAFTNTKFVCWERGIQSLKLKRQCDLFNIASCNVSPVYAELTEKLETFPNTGTVAIHHLLSFALKELYITGISFFQEPYYKNYSGDGAAAKNWQANIAPNQIWQHHFRPQLTYFRSLYANDTRIKVDSCLEKILAVN